MAIASLWLDLPNSFEQPSDLQRRLNLRGRIWISHSIAGRFVSAVFGVNEFFLGLRQ
jgi:hypothetical protein